MPATTTLTDQHHTPAEGVAACHPFVETLSRVPAELSHPGAQRSVAEARVALLQAELQAVCDERDDLREQLRTLERRNGELRTIVSAAMSEQERRSESSQQALIQRYERVIAEKNEMIESATRATDRSVPARSSGSSVLAAVRESLATFARR